MLARTFLSARELRCSEIERQAAMRLLDLLERGQLKYVPLDCMSKQSGLNISTWGDDDGGCLGGWIELLKGRDMSARMFNSWGDLFEPPMFDVAPQFYTPARCARALHAKLTTGKADWSCWWRCWFEVMGEIDRRARASPDMSFRQIARRIDELIEETAQAA